MTLLRRVVRIGLFSLMLSGTVMAQDGAVQHQVEPTDTLGTLSRLYGVSPERLRASNDGHPPKPGQLLSIPPAENGWPLHWVEEGQTVEQIGAGYGLPVEQLLQANEMERRALKAGESLVIPRARKPEWDEAKAVPSQPRVVEVTAAEPKVTEETKSASEVPKSRRPQLSSRSARPTIRSPKTTGDWVQVTLPDGRVGWARKSSLQQAEPKPVSSVSFGKKLNATQKEAVHQMVSDLSNRGFSVQADDIINFMALETGGSFDPSIRNQYNGAVGLAQFTTIAVQDMNRRRSAGDKLTLSGLARMSFTEQSKIVTDYLSTAFSRKGMKGKTIHASDLYAAIFCPKAIGLPLNSTVYSSGRDPGPYHRNRSLDTNRDGHITKKEMVARLQEWERRGEKLRG